ncbi:DUF418 domain-containing protein [Gottfriedia acidiceleris]|uniref:DUF418 domain-containing protein n=1 Tax=Bacillaceae TaxID=186817 RepID=UPI000BEC7F95|nr:MULTISPECIES: DUF418 domain-containing protein [unclassified Bacillus (in: firmicutes)]PEC47765.1 hypothetical protein CON00_20390 [Bacillus sp. AFS096315]PFM82983.1 hypothetical protein COJ46_04030 [Bacillus sp. AFS077874]
MEKRMVSSENRIDILDAIRGFALYGIFTINIASFTIGGPPGFVKSSNEIDNWMTTILLLLVESKFFTLFSFLFGVGFSIQLINANKKNKLFIPQFTRRLFGLFLFGLAHIYFLWDGDILLLYALVGGILLLFRNSSEKKLIKWVGGLLIIPICLLTVVMIGITVLRNIPEYGIQIHHIDVSFLNEFRKGQIASNNPLTTSSFFQTAKERIVGYIEIFPLLFSRIPSVLSMFLLGYFVGKKGYIYNIENNTQLFSKIAKWGLIIGLSLNSIIIFMFEMLPPLSSVIVLFFNQYLTGPILSLSFATCFILLFKNKRFNKLLKNFEYTGRLALSNYIFQSIIYSILFYGYGLGLYGKISTWQAIAITFVIYTIQIYLSKLWLKYFRIGLLEWLWRVTTKLEILPIKR